MSLQVELATEGSSSTTTTSVGSIAFAFGATVVIILVAFSGKVLLSFGTGEQFTFRGSRLRKQGGSGFRHGEDGRLAANCLIRTRAPAIGHRPF
jgi:hypothetical protein